MVHVLSTPLIVAREFAPKALTFPQQEGRTARNYVCRRVGYSVPDNVDYGLQYIPQLVFYPFPICIRFENQPLQLSTLVTWEALAGDGMEYISQGHTSIFR